jgi:hypothetical protein
VSGHRRLLFSVIYGAFFAASPQKTGLSAAIFWLRQKDFRFYPLRTHGLLRFVQFNSIKRW